MAEGSTNLLEQGQHKSWAAGDGRERGQRKSWPKKSTKRLSKEDLFYEEELSTEKEELSTEKEEDDLLFWPTKWLSKLFPFYEEELSTEKEELSTEKEEDDLLFKAIKKALLSSAAKQVLGEEWWEEMIRKAVVLTRKKDFLHFVWSSQPESISEYVDFRKLRRDISHMNQELGELKANLLSNNNHEKFQHVRRSVNAIKERIKKNFQDVESSLPHEDSGIWAFIPREDDIMRLDESSTRKSFPHEDDIMKSDESLTHKMEFGLMPETGGDEILEMAIDSAICRVSKCIEDGIFRKIGISGCGGEKVANALKEMQKIRCISVVRCISVSRHHSIKEVRQNIATQTSRLRFPKTDYTSKGSMDQYLPYNMLLLVDCIDGPIDLHDLEIPNCRFLMLTTQLQKIYDIMDLDLEIRMEDHLLPWELFCRNVGPSLVHSSSVIQQMAIRLVKACRGHLRAIVLLARALKGVTDIGVWELALNQLTSQSSYQQVQGMSHVMVQVLHLIWDQKDIIKKRCIKNCTHQQKWSADSLVSNWIQNGLVETWAKGKVILQELINSFLLENVDNDSFVRMHEETKIVLQKYFIPSLLLRQVGLGLTETPKVEEWIDFMGIELMNNKLSELPENPKCPFLQNLLLHNNHDLMEIPEVFFKDMPHLTHLDLSYTSIKSLPPSISNLKSLKNFFLRGCELLMELPPHIGALKNLEKFDLEGTEIMYLPKEIGKLINLTCFKVSFCQQANRYKETKQIDTTIPTGVLSKLNRLRELSIDVNLDDEWWDADVKVILNELSSLKSLCSLELYLPSVESLQQLRWDSTELMYPNFYKFRFIVGRHRQRIISHLPHEVEEILKEQKKLKKCLEYINGEGTPTEIAEALKHATLFFLDRHWTVKMLSEFGNENMVNLKFCLLMECNELQTIIDGDCKYPLGVDKEPVFEWLTYLGIHYMRSLQSIWKGPIDEGCLSHLRVLALHTCPNLTTIFTPDLLGNLNKLEELIVEDCCKIKSLVSQESSDLKHEYVLRRLTMISLLDLPELVSISDVLSISPILKNLVVYNCPKLKILYDIEVSCNNLKIKGEKEWLAALKWHESESSNSPRLTYEELGRGEDLMEELAKDIYSRQQWMLF